MTRALAAAYLACLFFAGQDSPHALTAAAAGPLVGFLALAFALRRLTTKGSTHT